MKEANLKGICRNRRSKLTPVTIKEGTRLGRVMVLAKALQAERANPYGKRIMRIDHYPFQAGKDSMKLTCHQGTGWFFKEWCPTGDTAFICCQRVGCVAVATARLALVSESPCWEAQGQVPSPHLW